jgi:ribosomal-protein-alanine N-acetyltransferase
VAIAAEPISIEPMIRGDLPDIVRIEQRSYPAPWNAAAYETELANASACYLVARFGSSPVGYAGMWVIMDEAHITTIAVDPEFRGMRVGGLLMLALLEEARLRGATRATLEVREHNDAAKRLYARYGFKQAGLRRKYYADNQENALILWAENIDSYDFPALRAELRMRIERESRDRSGD